jgi:hypothetical protein
VSVADVDRLIQYLMYPAAYPLTEQQIEAADTNENGAVDKRDVWQLFYLTLN